MHRDPREGKTLRTPDDGGYCVTGTTVGSSWASSAAVRKVMQGNRKRDTRPEIALRRELHSRGLRYRVAVRPLKDCGTADIVFRRARVAVFVDGCFWHACPEHFHAPRTNPSYWAAKIERNRLRDAAVDARLDAAGWKSVRVWEHEDSAAAAVRVANEVNSRAKRGRRTQEQSASLSSRG